MVGVVCVNAALSPRVIDCWLLVITSRGQCSIELPTLVIREMCMMKRMGCASVGVESTLREVREIALGYPFH